LTSLATQNGTYDRTRTDYEGGNSSGVFVANARGDQLNFMSIISAMEFDRLAPKRVAAASPVTGLFLDNGNGHWHALTAALPKPLPSISSVGISADVVLAGTEGRGVLKIGGTLSLPKGDLFVNRVGNGRVTSNPTGIDCGVTCSASYEFGSVVTLAATPDPGWTFVGWSAPCPGTGLCLAPADGETITATFASNQPQSHKLVLNIVKGAEPGCIGHGDVIITTVPPFIQCFSATGSTATTCSTSIPPGSTVTLQEQHDQYSNFIGYSDACNGNSCMVTMSTDRTVTATYCGTLH
jgi:hypothetical protein